MITAAIAKSLVERAAADIPKSDGPSFATIAQQIEAAALTKGNSLVVPLPAEAVLVQLERQGFSVSQIGSQIRIDW